jgi:tRNA(fMet)-specific endonuclease VapC
VSFLLDADTCSAAIKQERKVFACFVQYMGRLFTSRIVVVELFDWALGAAEPSKRFDAIQDLRQEVAVLEFDEDCTMDAAKLRRWLRDHGCPVPEMDVLIAATARVHDFTLVTHNTKDFAAIPGLRLADWLIP